MQVSVIQQRLTAYRQWKTHVSRAVSELESWLESEGRATPESHERIDHTLDALDRDRLTIAFVGEVSRGKTELINAIFFAEYGHRLLPSAPGGTTLCPTELLWDQGRSEAYLRLLPIESHTQDVPVAQLKRDPSQWVHYPLRIQDPDQTTSTLKEVSQTKTLTVAQATRLGLPSVGRTPDGQRPANRVEVPKWRHAIVSFPHPLLEQGLVVLDTPGPSTLGSEPELTLSMLPSAQAIIFVLAADTGVTRTDLEMWQHYLKGFQSGPQQRVIVALNKNDILSDESQGVWEINTRIARQRERVAHTLGISEAEVFPVSAQNAVLAKIRDDNALLDKSELPRLESHLSSRMLEKKHRDLLDALEADVGQLLEHNRTRILNRIGDTEAQLQEIEQLREKSNGVIGHLLEKTREEQEKYLKGVSQFQMRREELLRETRLSRRILDPDAMTSLVDDAHRKMVRSWTTLGLAIAMKSLFDELRRAMQTLTDESERIGKLMHQTYQEFEEDFDLNVLSPEMFVPTKFREEIELLHKEAETFRKSPAMALGEQGIVIKRFQQQIVDRALLLFGQLRITFETWNRDALQPLAEQIQEHKVMMEERLENLKRIGRSKDSLQTRIDDLHRQHLELAQQLTALRNIHNALHYDPLVDEQRSVRPHLVAGTV